MYKQAVKNQQKISRLSLAEIMGSDFEELPKHQQRENLVLKFQQMSKIPKKSQEDGQIIWSIQQAITEIRPRRKGFGDIQHHFIDLCKEELHKLLFNRLMTEATNRAKQELEENNN
jgi:hypothetical protein